jgi:hypothetical protein
LRAIVQRDGTFKSPSTGRSFDFNEDLAEPLLARLPVSWEQYFTNDLGRVTDDLVVQVTEKGKSFCEKARLIVELLFKRRSDAVEKQLAWFEDRVAVLAETAKKHVLAAVRERRGELASKMPLVAQERMRPAYTNARGESGSGMKKRMVDHLEPAARESAQPIFSTIQIDLLEGLGDLELVILAMFRKLVDQAEEQARIVAHNANIDVDSTATDPAIEALLASMPTIK